MSVLRMTKRELTVNLIAIATSLVPLRQIPRLLEVADDRRRRSFGDANRGGDVSDPSVRIRGDALEHVRVVRHEPPKMIFFSCS
jgi:hypothetical protein